MPVVELLADLPRHRVEYLRNAAALLPAAGDPDPGIAILSTAELRRSVSLTCDCRAFQQKKNCAHVGELSGVAAAAKAVSEIQGFDAVFRSSVWHRLAEALNEMLPVAGQDLSLRETAGPDGAGIRLQVFQNDRLLCTYYLEERTGNPSGISESDLLAQRTGLCPVDENPFHRGRVLDMLALLTLTESERVMLQHRLRSRRQALESGFWYRLAYHCREMFGPAASLEHRIDADGACCIRCLNGEAALLEIAVPREAVVPSLKALRGDFQEARSARVVPESMESIVKITVDDNNDLTATLYLLFHLPDGVTEAVERRRLRNYWYQDAVYVPWRNMIATWRKPDRLWKQFGGKYKKKIRRDRLPEILDNIEDFFAPPHIVDDKVKDMAVHRNIQRIILSPSAAEGDWCWLSMDYGFGENAVVSLADIYTAKLSGKRYLPVLGGWVDTRAVDLEPVMGGPGNPIARQLSNAAAILKLSRAEVLRLRAYAGEDVEFRIETDTDDGEKGENAAAGETLRRLIGMIPAARIGELTGFSGYLREYQRHGLEWLAFLYENRLGGLLCDEMGLGKTHQIMGLMAWLATQKKEATAFLVVCPTTVISHWDRKIREYAPALRPVVYHGVDRDLEKALGHGAVLITSYGVLLRDGDHLSRIRFGLAAFDEAQFLKNTATKTYGAAMAINAAMKVAVTGTPVENRLMDLKALMDLALPGYLGTDSFFMERYENAGAARIRELRRLSASFILRRTKAKVLAELPEKIEDFRYCRLTETQVRLYREAVAARRSGLLAVLEKEDQAIPYVHIFALLTLLKQICNHPASVSGNGTKVPKGGLESGKWQVFTELLDACLENDQKVVVFSQFVKMLDIIEAYLTEKDIGHAGITGKTRRRGLEIDRFNEDPSCRVFVGSLKAGGSGIDLIGGSVVVHYDRWWNAAKEDQATDRVHRIGQTRGVQVFKLITEGTLEEKISALIDRKRKLMNDAVPEDDPGLLKTFTREELADLLALPESEPLETY